MTQWRADWHAEQRAALAGALGSEAAKQRENEQVVANAKRDGKEGNLYMDAEGRMRLRDEADMGADCGSYRWEQNEEEVTIKVRVPAGTKSKAVALKVKSEALTLVVLGETILDGALHKMVAPDDCTFTLEDVADGRMVVVTLQKLQRTAGSTHWTRVCVGEPEIDTATFGPAVVSADPTDPSSIARLMEGMGGS